MAKGKIRIDWHKPASQSYLRILEHLYKESPTAASIVGNAILNEIDKLPKHPTSHPLDRFKKRNDGNYRAFIVFSYRISYYFDNDVIYILRLRHTSREPLKF
jgi:plasmid stabilization system protein ParE